MPRYEIGDDPDELGELEANLEEARSTLEVMPLPARVVRRQMERLTRNLRIQGGRYGAKAWYEPNPQRPGGVMCMLSVEFPTLIPFCDVWMLATGETDIREVNAHCPWYTLFSNNRMMYGDGVSSATAAYDKASEAEERARRADAPERAKQDVDDALRHIGYKRQFGGYR